MATPAQILANRQNAERSSGPVTATGKARVSQNATKLGLFSVANFVRPEEQDIFGEFESGYLAELAPVTSLEQTLAREIIHAAWRLRRCASLEVAPPENLTDEELDRLQTSIDRARAAAQRTFHRSLKELRRLQTENLHPAEVMIKQAMAMDALLKKDLEQRQRQLTENAAQSADTKQTQSEPEKTTLIPRSAPCPCKSGEKYKRCCGKNAPPVLSNPVA
ncbi:MAG TPA: SEC-C domain-containing protein [Candidatus Angelobacter sp.]|nr:SEC-C domain-containing protein [Candidatus Angelobacter sp.]